MTEVSPSLLAPAHSLACCTSKQAKKSREYDNAELFYNQLFTPFSCTNYPMC